MIQDVVIIGGGVIGLTTAYELAGRGFKVTLLDQQQPGQEASWAGAGILPPAYPGDPAHPLAGLTRATNTLWPKLSSELREKTGIDNGFRRCGGLGVSDIGDTESLQSEVQAWQQAGTVVETLTNSNIQSCEQAVSTEIHQAYRLPDLAQVRNPWHLKALLVACQLRGVDIRPGQKVVGFERNHARVTSVQTTHDRFEAGAVVVAAGAWSQELLKGAGCQLQIEPVRGQIVLLSYPNPPFRHVIECGPRYLVPREDGRVLVGSTEEWVGYVKQNTALGLQRLLTFAQRLVPSLKDARFERAWAGLRPHTKHGMPFIGRVPDTQNLFVAAGHFRAGLHLSPITARVISQLINRENPDLDVSGFSPAIAVSEA
ncbi:MAG: glycine oxidase ThiO [Planctomycetaceae bacterium]|nr:glycine oxidase ThiO [Planctomycetaceae bacterium]